MKKWLLVAALASASIGSPAGALTLEFIGEQIIPTGSQFSGTTVGGLSGIDYRPATNDFLVISDDRSQANPARYYTVSLNVTPTGFTGVTFNSVTTLLNASGNPYPALSIDPESIRFRASDGRIVYTSEGDKNLGIDAFIRTSNADGTNVSDSVLPTYYQQSGPSGTTGLRQNLAFESLTLSPSGTMATVATENALIQDGPTAAFGVASPARIMQIDTASNAVIGEYVYMVDGLTAASPTGGFSTNGLVELLDLGGGKYLSVERSFVTGLTKPWSTTGNGIKIFEIDTTGATNVAGITSLNGQSYMPVTKSLVLDLDSLMIPLDNIEGITWGPTLSDGSQSLILVSDNNFSATQFTQFLAFKVSATSAVPEPESWAMMIMGFAMIGGTLRQRVRTVAVGY